MIVKIEYQASSSNDWCFNHRMYENIECDSWEIQDRVLNLFRKGKIAFILSLYNVRLIEIAEKEKEEEKK